MSRSLRGKGTGVDPTRIERIGSTLRSQTNFDVIVLASPVNTWYASQVVVMTQKTLPERLALIVWPRDGEPTYIVCTLEELQAEAESWITDIRSYFEFRESPVGVLAEVLREKKLAKATIGIETDFLTVHYFDELRRALPEAVFRPCQTLMQSLRQVKTADEVRRMEAAAQATDRAIRRAFESVRIGDTERAISGRLQSFLLEDTADNIAFIVLAAGKNACLTHPVPGEYRVQAGDIIRTDFGGAFSGGYYSDVARTMVVARPRKDQSENYRKLWGVHTELIDMFRPGVRPSEIYARGKQLNLESGLSFDRPHIGHGLGIEMHESPMINPYGEAPLVPGMLFSIEPNHLVPHVEKYHLEDLVLVTDGAPRVLSRSADWSDLLCSG